MFLLGSTNMLRDQLVLAMANVTGQAGLVAMPTEMLNLGERIYNYSSDYEGPDSSFDASVGSSFGASNVVLLVVVNVMLLQMQIHVLLVDMEKAMNRQLPLAGIRALLRSLFCFDIYIVLASGKDHFDI